MPRTRQSYRPRRGPRTGLAVIVMPAALSRVLPLASVDSVPGPFGGGFGTRRPLPVLAAAARIGLAAGLEFGGPRVLH